MPGKFSQSLKLAPGASVVISGNDLSFNQSFTLSLWAKILDDAEGTILSNGQVRLEYRDDLKLYGSVYTQNGWEEVSSFAQGGKWTHYALSLTNSQLMMFINGDQVSSKNLTTAMTWENLDDRDLYLGSPEAINWSMEGIFCLMKCGFMTVLSNSEKFLRFTVMDREIWEFVHNFMETLLFPYPRHPSLLVFGKTKTTSQFPDWSYPKSMPLVPMS